MLTRQFWAILLGIVLLGTWLWMEYNHRKIMRSVKEDEEADKK